MSTPRKSRTVPDKPAKSRTTRRTGSRSGRSAVTASRRPPPSGTETYTLEVYLLGGPVSEKYAGKTVFRTLELAGKHTLCDLHVLIFKAFDREEEEPWEFQFGDEFHDPKNVRYGPPPCGRRVKNASRVSLDSLELKPGTAFGYVFDPVEDWCHSVQVKKVSRAARAVSPRIVKRVGKSPPQHDEDDIVFEF